MAEGRMYVALCLLAGAWVVVYWVWDAPTGATPAPRITFAGDPEPEPAADDPLTVEPTPAPPESGVIAPEFEIYVVQRDDETWATISQTLYATPDHADALIDANPYVVRLAPGRQIRFPLDPTNVRGRRIGDEPDPADIEPEDPEQQPAPPEPEGPEIIAEHTVKDGEVLGAISRQYYGSSKHWRVILDFNKDRLGISDERAIRAGHVLYIPRLDD